MEIKIDNKEEFVKRFLTYISKIADSCVLNISGNRFSCLVSTPDNSVINHIEYTQNTDIENKISLSIGDIKKLIRALESIEEDSDALKLEFNSNHLKYKGKNTQFKFHLLENGVINEPKISLAKLADMKFDIKFDLTYSKLNEIFKASTFAQDTNKVYFISNGSEIYAELTDKARHNVDSFTIKIVEGTFEQFQMSLNFEVFRIISSIKASSFKIFINNKIGFIVIDLGQNNSPIKAKYIVSSLTK